MSISAMKQALEALEAEANIYIHTDPEDGPPEQMVIAITALRQAIAEAEKQEPVIGTKTWFEDGKVVIQHLHPSDIYKDPHPKQEPVAAQHRFRHPQKTMPDWSVWQPAAIANRPAWEIDSQGYEVEYRLLYTAPVHAIDISQERVDETAKHEHDLVYRLRKRAEIRRQIPDRKSVQEGQPDRIADLLEEAAEAFESAKQRGWVGLTDEDKQWAFDETQEGGGFWEFADAIEAKLKEKNNG